MNDFGPMGVYKVGIICSRYVSFGINENDTILFLTEPFHKETKEFPLQIALGFSNFITCLF
jgi:hypothetical protein